MHLLTGCQVITLSEVRGFRREEQVTSRNLFKIHAVFWLHVINNANGEKKREDKFFSKQESFTKN